MNLSCYLHVTRSFLFKLQDLFSYIIQNLFIFLFLYFISSSSYSLLFFLIQTLRSALFGLYSKLKVFLALLLLNININNTNYMKKKKKKKKTNSGKVYRHTRTQLWTLNTEQEQSVAVLNLFRVCRTETQARSVLCPRGSQISSYWLYRIYTRIQWSFHIIKLQTRAGAIIESAFSHHDSKISAE